MRKSFVLAILLIAVLLTITYARKPRRRIRFTPRHAKRLTTRMKEILRRLRRKKLLNSQLDLFRNKAEFDEWSYNKDRKARKNRLKIKKLKEKLEALKQKNLIDYENVDKQKDSIADQIKKLQEQNAGLIKQQAEDIRNKIIKNREENLMRRLARRQRLLTKREAEKKIACCLFNQPCCGKTKPKDPCAGGKCKKKISEEAKKTQELIKKLNREHLSYLRDQARKRRADRRAKELEDLQRRLAAKVEKRLKRLERAQKKREKRKAKRQEKLEKQQQIDAELNTALEERQQELISLLKGLTEDRRKAFLDTVKNNPVFDFLREEFDTN